VLVAVVLTVASLGPWNRDDFAADRETVLYSFCTQGSSCTDDTDPLPQTGLIKDVSGKLYGTTPGVEYGCGEGTVFALTPNAARTKWTETVLVQLLSTGAERVSQWPSPLRRPGYGRIGEALWDDKRRRR
jgi:hypothetical protein